MSIDYYDGVPGVAIEIENGDEVREALDILHTQVLDNLLSGERKTALLRILSQAIQQVRALGFDADF